MPTINATATISNDISYTLLQLGSNQQSEAGKTNYTVSLTTPTGTPTGLQMNYGVQTSGTLPSGGKVYFDLQSFPKRSFGSSQNISFTKVKGLVIENSARVSGYDMRIAATGGNAFTEPFNGGSGSVIIKPYASYQYADPLTGATVDATNKDWYLEDRLGSGIAYTVVIIGVTG